MPGPVARRVEGLEDALELLPRDARPAVADAQQQLVGGGPGADGDRLVARDSGRRCPARWRSPARAARRRPGAAAGRASICTSKPPGGSGTPRSPLAPAPRPSTSPRAARPRPPGASTGRAGCRPAATSAALSSAITEVSSARASARASSEPSPAAAVVIAVSGERRSCETERSTAVLTTFERRSAFVSITCVSSSSRLRAAATSVSSAGSTRSCRASSTFGSMSRGTITVPTREPSTSSGSARWRSSESAQDSSIDTDGRSKVVATCRPAERSDSSRSAPPSRSRAISAVRSASRRRVSASSARARAASASALIATAAMKNTASATQFSPSRDGEAAGGRDVEEVPGRRAHHRGQQAQPEAPVARHEQHGERVDDRPSRRPARPRAGGRSAA